MVRRWLKTLYGRGAEQGKNYLAADECQSVMNLNRRDTERVEYAKEKLYRQDANENKSLTAEAAKDAEEEKSLTAKVAKTAKETHSKTLRSRRQRQGGRAEWGLAEWGLTPIYLTLPGV